MDGTRSLLSKTSSVGSGEASTPRTRSRRPSAIVSLLTTPLPEKELKFLFDFNDVGKKGFLKKQELFNLLDRIRKRDRIDKPLGPEALHSVYFLLDPLQQDKVTWASFSTKFNTVFWQNRGDLYLSSTSASASEQQYPSGVFLRQLPSRSPRKTRSQSLSVEETHLPGHPEPDQSEVVAEQTHQLLSTAESPQPVDTFQRSRRASVTPFTTLPVVSVPTESVFDPSASPEQQREALEAVTTANMNGAPQQTAFLPKAGSKASPPLLPQHRAPPETLPERFRVYAHIPKLNPEQVAEKLRKVPGLPEAPDAARWVGRVRTKEDKPKDDDIPYFLCPNCRFEIDPAILDRQKQEWKSPYRDRQLPRAETLPQSSYIPLYGPHFYSGVWEFGRVVGVIPPSFFNSPYNIHTWRFKRPLS